MYLAQIGKIMFQYNTGSLPDVFKVFVASSLFEVVGSLQSKQNAGLSEQQQGYLFHMNVVSNITTLNYLQRHS